jgi:hypothetical protein
VGGYNVQYWSSARVVLVSCSCSAHYTSLLGGMGLPIGHTFCDLFINEYGAGVTTAEEVCRCRGGEAEKTVARQEGGIALHCPLTHSGSLGTPWM